jgi:hypothetical protein
VIPPTNINNALATLRSQISDTEGYIASEHPERWSRYKKPAVAGEAVSSHGAAAPATKAAPMTATNPKTGQRITSYDGGQTWR